jgi:hypothetical protein
LAALVVGAATDGVALGDCGFDAVGFGVVEGVPPTLTLGVELGVELGDGVAALIDPVPEPESAKVPPVVAESVTPPIGLAPRDPESACPVGFNPRTAPTPATVPVATINARFIFDLLAR